MSFNMNPYSQGWSKAGSTHSTPWAQEGGVPPSVYGALPSIPISSVPGSMQPDSVTFQFTSFNSTILNCAILGPRSHVAYRVVTDSTCTILKDNEGRNIAMVQWQPNASIEIRGVAPRQRVRDWLRLSSDRSSRLMEVKGIQYAWAPMDGFICLYRTQTSAPKVLVRIARASSKVLLEFTQEALQMGILEPCLFATVMLVCGHNID